VWRALDETAPGKYFGLRRYAMATTIRALTGRSVLERVRTDDLGNGWSSLLCDWDRSLRAGNYPETTRYNYLLAAAQLAAYLDTVTDDGFAAAAADPTAVQRMHLEDFQAWMVQTRSASTALNKHKALQQFFKYLVEEDEIAQSPMQRVRQPKTPRHLVPVLHPEETRTVLDSCRGTTFVDLRDHAIIRVLANTGARLSEVANLALDDLDLNRDVVTFRGKGAK
jgi:integrase/recombinase XerC